MSEPEPQLSVEAEALLERRAIINAAKRQRRRGLEDDANRLLAVWERAERAERRVSELEQGTCRCERDKSVYGIPALVWSSDCKIHPEPDPMYLIVPPGESRAQGLDAESEPAKES